MFDSLFPGLVVAFALVVIAIAVRQYWWSKRRERERTAAMRELAGSTGWVFAHGDARLIEALGDFELFSRGRSREIPRLLLAPESPATVAIFDYSYVVHDGESQSTVCATGIYVRDEAMALPHFSLRPENVLHKFASALGWQDIDFDDRPEFSRLFLLRGADEGAIRSAFAPPVTAIFERHAELHAEGRDDRLVWWHPGYAPFDRVERLMRDGIALARAWSSTQRVS